MAKTDQFRKEMEESREQLKKTADAAAGASEVIAASLAVLGAAAVAAGGAAVKMAAEWEQTEIAFTTLLKSGEKARAFLEELDRFAAVTPFEMPGLIDASRRLLAFGFQAEDVIPIMHSVGDAVAAMGGGAVEIDRVIRALGQMRARGVVAAEELTVQLTDVGIPAWEYLAEAIGVSVPEAMKMVERRMIPATVGISAILQGMTKDFGGAMEVQSKTMIGLWSTAKDQIRVLSRATGQYLIEAFNIKGLVEGLGKAFGGLADEIRQAATPAEGIRNILSRTFTPEIHLAVIGLAGAIAGALLPAFIKVAIAIWSAVLALGPFMIKGAAVALAAYVIYRAWADAGGGIAAVSVFMIRMVGAIIGVLGLLIPSFRAVSQRIYAYADSIAVASKAARETAKQAQAVTKSGETAANAQDALGDATEKAAKAAGKNIMAFDQVHTLQEEMAGAGAAAAAAMALPEMIVPAIDVAGQIQQQQDAVAQAVGPLDELAKKWDAVTMAMEKAKPVLETIGYIISGVLLVKVGELIYKYGILGTAAVINAAKVAGAWAVKAAAAIAHGATVIGQLALAGAKWAWLGIQAVINAAKVAGAWLVQKVQALASLAAQIPVFAIIVGKWIWMGIMALANAAKMAAAWFIALGPIGWVIAAITAVAIAVALNWDSISAWTKEKWGAVSTWLVETWDKIKTWAGEKWEAIKTAVWKPVETVIGWIKENWNTLVTTISRTWDTIKRRAEELWDNIKEAVVTRARTLRTDTERTLELLWEYIRGIPAKARTWGADIIAGLWNGINSWAGTLNSRVSDFFTNNFINPVKRLFRISSPSGLMMDFGQGIAVGMVQGVENNAHLVRGAGENIGKNITDPLNALLPGMSTMGKSLIEKLLDGMKGMEGNLRSMVREIENALQITVPQPKIPAAPAVTAPAAVTIPTTGLSPHAQSVIANPAFAGMSKAGQESLLRSLGVPGFARGINLVPRDMLAFLHQGEAVVPERFNPAAGYQQDADTIYQAVYAAMRDAIRVARVEQGREGQRQEAVIEFDTMRVGRALLPALIREGQRLGVSVIRLAEV